MKNSYRPGTLIGPCLAGILLGLGRLVGLGVPVPIGVAPAAAAIPPSEFVGITTTCFGVVEPFPDNDLTPAFIATMYNLPSGANPTASYTLAYGGRSIAWAPKPFRLWTTNTSPAPTRSGTFPFPPGPGIRGTRRYLSPSLGATGLVAVAPGRFL